MISQLPGSSHLHANPARNGRLWHPPSFKLMLTQVRGDWPFCEALWGLNHLVVLKMLECWLGSAPHQCMHIYPQMLPQLEEMITLESVVLHYSLNYSADHNFLLP
jgi:hypothetical protein